MTLFNSRHPMIYWALLLICTAILLYEANNVYQLWGYNRWINNPERIVEADPVPPAEVLFAKAFFLNQQGEFQQALRLYKQIENAQGQYFTNRVQFNMGVIYLQQADKLWKAQGVWEYNQINTFLDLAEQSFRQVLIRVPENWQARFNLEYTLRIRPPAKEQENSDWTGRKSSVYAIMPGIPSGGP